MKDKSMSRNALLAMYLVATAASAQQALTPAAVPTDTPTPAAQAVVPMEEPQPGDHWTYEIRDEVTGKVTSTREHVITEVTPTTMGVRFKTLDGKGEESFAVYDRSWNMVEGRPWRYSPNDGSGIQPPLEVGKTWPVRTNNINRATGAIWRRSGISKVVGQESITTKAGTFDTFKIETTFTGTNVNNPLMKNEVTSLTWYAPAIDHWVRRSHVSRANKHVRINNLIELIEYGRKQS
jgi:hypothetical protein